MINVPEIVLLTNDQGNLDRAKAIGVVACSSIRLSCSELIVVEEYIKDLEDGDMLMDMMSANSEFERSAHKRGENIYPEVLDPLLQQKLIIVLFFREDTIWNSIRHITFWRHYDFAI
jgi:hypothetical protein